MYFRIHFCRKVRSIRSHYGNSHNNSGWLYTTHKALRESIGAAKTRPIEPASVVLTAANVFWIASAHYLVTYTTVTLHNQDKCKTNKKFQAKEGTIRFLCCDLCDLSHDRMTSEIFARLRLEPCSNLRSAEYGYRACRGFLYPSCNQIFWQIALKKVSFLQNRCCPKY